MKRLLTLFLCMVMISAMGSFAGTVSATETETGASFTNGDIIKELAFAYDRKGEKVLYDQYYARRNIYSSPEEATSQRTMFMDCSSYVNACYLQGFGVNVLPYVIYPNGKSPSTENYNNYARDNADAPDVVGYWEPQTYKTDEERKAVTEDIYAKLQVGDVLVYRHGKTSGTSGHTYIYMGERTFIHCAGWGSYKLNEENPALSYDSNVGEVGTRGTIETIEAENIFENISHKRYVFKNTEADTVWSFGVIRPFARNLTPTEEALNRMAIAGLVMEKTSSVWENATVDAGDVLTYTVSLENTNEKALEGVTIRDTLPAGTEFVSGDEGVTAQGNVLTWSGTVPAMETVSVHYSVRITETVPGSLIVSDETYVSGVQLGNITHTVSGYSETQRALIGDKAIKFANQSKTFTDSIAMVKAVYKDTFNVDLFDYNTPEEVLDQLIDTPNRTKQVSTELSRWIAPNMYGGRGIRYGWLYLPSENERTRLPKEEHLAVGDIIVADWKSGNDVYVYAGDKQLVTVQDGVAKTLTIGDDIYTPGVNVLISLLGYTRYAVLRPSLNADAAKVDVASIEVAAQPAKTIYQNGDTFDSTGMVVKATLTDGSVLELDHYSISEAELELSQKAVTVHFGDKTADVDIQVHKTACISVSEAATLGKGTQVTVEGIVVGVAHEGFKNDTELIIKDVEKDTLMAVRNIPYGSFPDFGYDKGDRIVFDAVIKKDESTPTSYASKLYLNFSSSNGTIDETIISKNNQITYLFDNVTEIDSWDEMKSQFHKNLKPYTYFKFKPGTYIYRDNSADSSANYRLHYNEGATKSSGTGTAVEQYVTLRNDAMTKNMGSQWRKLLFDKELLTVPGARVDKEFYGVYIGGNGKYHQIVVLDENWISDDEGNLVPKQEGFIIE